MPLDEVLKYANLASDVSTVLIACGAIVALFSYLQEKRQQRKQNFVLGTERYKEIQKMIIDTEALTKLNLNIFKSSDKFPPASAEAIVFSKELAMCGIMFQLMEDVWLTQDLDINHYNKLNSGWINLFSDWMKAEEVRSKWPLLKDHFSYDFKAYIERTILNPLENNEGEV